MHLRNRQMSRIVGSTLMTTMCTQGGVRFWWFPPPAADLPSNVSQHPQGSPDTQEPLLGRLDGLLWKREPAKLLLLIPEIPFPHASQ